MRLLIIFMLAAASLPAQNLKFKIKQLPKDTSVGRVVLSSLTDSTMTYSDLLKIDNDSLYFNGSGVLTSAMDIGGGSGSVTSVDVSGGTTGLTTSGGPITSSGEITLAGTLNVANGGTGSTTKNFVDLSTTQTVGGAKTFTSDIEIDKNTQGLYFTGSASTSGAFPLTFTSSTPSGGFNGEKHTIDVSGFNAELVLANDGNAVVTINKDNDMIVDDSTLYVDATNNRVGIGTNSPIGPLDISSGNLSGAIILGGDEDAFTRTNNEVKWARMVAPHYDNSEENVMLFSAATFSNNNDILIGGGASATNSATRILFITAANTTTTSGTVRLAIISNGNVGIGTTSPSAKLHTLGTTDGTALTIQDADGTCTTNPEASTIVFSCTSDQRVKTNIREAENVLPYIMGIPIKQYNLIDNYESHTGVIAQELLNNYPELVTMGQDNLYKVSTIPHWKVIKAIQEQQAIIENLQAQINELKELINK